MASRGDNSAYRFFAGTHPLASEVDDARRCIAHVYRVLSNQQDLSPRNEVITTTLQQFVRALLAWRDAPWADALITDPALREIRRTLPRLCGEAEALMEKWWTRRLLGRGSVRMSDLQCFWYYENYLDLMAAEWRLLQGISVDHVTLVGSGAFPLTALLLVEQFGVQKIECIDLDEEANSLASELIAGLGYDRAITTITKAASSVEFDPNTFPICGSFVPFEHFAPALHASSIKSCLVRDVEGVFQLCYYPKDLAASAYVETSCTGSVPKVINVSRLLVRATGVGLEKGSSLLI